MKTLLKYLWRNVLYILLLVFIGLLNAALKEAFIYALILGVSGSITYMLSDWMLTLLLLYYFPRWKAKVRGTQLSQYNRTAGPLFTFIGIESTTMLSLGQKYGLDYAVVIATVGIIFSAFAGKLLHAYFAKKNILHEAIKCSTYFTTSKIPFKGASQIIGWILTDKSDEIVNSLLNKKIHVKISRFRQDIWEKLHSLPEDKTNNLIARLEKETTKVASFFYVLINYCF